MNTIANCPVKCPEFDPQTEQDVLFIALLHASIVSAISRPLISQPVPDRRGKSTRGHTPASKKRLCHNARRLFQLLQIQGPE